MLDEFKKFILRGNVLDLAVGVIIGAAFNAISKSLVDDVVMPPLGMLLGKADFSNLFITLKDGAHGPYPTLDAAKAGGAVTLRYGLFLNTVINFMLTAFAIFLLIKGINRLYKPVAAESKECPFCTTLLPIKATRCSACTSEQPELPKKKKKA